MFNDLKPFDLDKLDALDLDELAQPWEGQYTAETYGETLDLDASARIETSHHYVRDATSLRSMREAMGSLPTAGEAIHLWVGGQLSMGAVIPAVAELAAPAMLDALTISTLTFSKDNAAEWVAMLDAGKIKTAAVYCSHYFAKTSTGIYEYAAALFEPRGIELVTARIHAKLILAKLTDGRTVSAEGSANTRSCRTLEQVTLFGSPEVYAFHVGQLEKVIHGGRREQRGSLPLRISRMSNLITINPECLAKVVPRKARHYAMLAERKLDDGTLVFRTDKAFYVANRATFEGCAGDNPVPPPAVQQPKPSTTTGRPCGRCRRAMRVTT